MSEEVTAQSQIVNCPAYAESFKKLSKRYSENGLSQLMKVFLLYDTDKTSKVTVEVLPRICTDLSIKPWKALKEIDVEEGVITFTAFAEWWFSQSTQHSREEEEYVNHVFDSYDTKKTGNLDSESLMKLCKDLKLKPWKAFNEMDVDPKEGVTKKKFIKWWFSADNSSSRSKSNEATTPAASPSKSRRTSITGSAPKCPSTSSSPTVSDCLKKLSDIQIQMAELNSLMAALVTNNN